MEKQRLRQVQARVSGLLEEALSGKTPRTIDEIEETALRLREKVGEILAQQMADAAHEAAERRRRLGLASSEEGDVEKEPEEPADESHTLECSCGRVARFKGVRSREITTMAGVVQVERSYFYCRLCDAGTCPADAVMGLPAGAFSARVEQEIARVSALLPFAPAAHLLYELTGVFVCPKQAQRIAEAAGERALVLREEQRDQAMAGEALAVLRPGPAVLYLEADGVHTPTLEGYKETKVGLARGLNGDAAPTGPTLYVSHLGGAEKFGEHWYGLALSAGLEQAEKAVVLGDGAAWIWSQASYHFPGAIQILDVFHATEHLYEAARTAYGEGDARTRAWGDARKQELFEGQIGAILSALDELAMQQPHAQEVVRKTKGYIENNRHRMDYPRYRAMGLSIGSGAAESGCKQVISQRLKGAGMRWKEKGAQAIAALRCFLLSGLWQDFTHAWRAARTLQPALS